MIFKTIPQNGSSWRESLLYKIEFEQRMESAEVEIFDQLTSTTVATLRLYNVKSTEVDIAPYIRSMMASNGLHSSSAIITTSKDACRVVLRAAGEESEPRLFFRANLPQDEPKILTSPAHLSPISNGEKIRISIYAHQKVSLTIVRPMSAGGVRTLTYTTNGVPCEVSVNVIGAYEGTNIAVRIKCDDMDVEDYTYRVVTREQSAYRVVWENSCGGLESYTFPQSIKRSLTVKSEEVHSESGWYRRVVESKLVRRLLMLGVIQAEVDRVLNILISPKVYMCGGDLNRPLRLLTEEVRYDEHGKLRHLELDVEEEWKGGVGQCA